MKTLRKIILVSFIIGGMFTSIQFTQGSTILTNLSVFALGDKISAGPDATICNDQNFTSQEFNDFTGLVMWTTSGDGVFTNCYNSNACYTPGVQDIILGHVELTISILPYRTYSGRMVSDTMILTIVNCEE